MNVSENNNAILYSVQNKTVSFNVRRSTSTSGSVTVVGTPAYLSYWSCTTGSANVNIKVNDSSVGTYVIPASAGTTINVPISCSVGDRITYTVYPATGYDAAVGSFTIHY